jgi:RNA polymerase sigma-70 factor (ECF subfamily)
MTSEPDDQRDQEDMRRLCQGHPAALNDLMARHAPRLFHYLLRQLQDERDAEDLAQETFVRVFQHRHRFDPRHRFRTWLYRIATNLARDRLRWRARHPHASLEAGGEVGSREWKDSLPADVPDPGQALVQEERAAAVRAAVARLPEDLRTPLILAEYEDRSYQEIATLLQCSAKAVEMRLYRARQRLREWLAPWLDGP